MIELMASLSLASLLAIAILGIAAQLGRDLAAVRNSAPLSAWQAVFKAQLEREYQAARAIRVTPTTLVIEGYFQSRSRDLRFGPSRIEYRITTMHGGRFLLRTERHLDSGAPQLAQANVSIVGIRSIELKTRLETDVPPGNLALAVWMAGDRVRPALDFVLLRHGVAP